MQWQPERRVMPQRRIAGMNGRFRMGDTGGIGAQWAAYNAAGQSGPDVVPMAWYGVCHDVQGEDFAYLCGMELLPGAAAPAGAVVVELPAGHWACFVVKDGMDRMRDVWEEVYSHWLKQPEWQGRPGPSVEYYPPEFDGETGQGGFEIWVPVV